MDVMKKPGMKLVECAETLLKLNLSSSVLEIEKAIKDGYYHLEGLKASPKCKTLLINSLAHRIERVEGLLEQKEKQEAV